MPNRILVVDEEICAQYFRRDLGDLVTTVETSYLATQELKKERYKVLIVEPFATTDGSWRRPDTSYIELMRAARQQNPDMKVIVTSIQHVESLSSRGFGIKPTDYDSYFVKPYNVNLLYMELLDLGIPLPQGIQKSLEILFGKNPADGATSC